MGLSIVDQINHHVAQLPGLTGPQRALIAPVLIDIDEYALRFIKSDVPFSNRVQFGTSLHRAEEHIRREHPQAAAWLPERYASSRLPVMRSQGPRPHTMRFESRLAFFAQTPIIRDRLHAIVSALLRPNSARSNTNTLRAHLFCSLAGETGSGCLLSAAYLLREVIQQHHQTPELYLHAILSTAIASHIEPFLLPVLHALSYANLKEIEHISAPSASRSFEYALAPVRTSQEQPFDLTLLYEHDPQEPTQAVGGIGRACLPWVLTAPSRHLRADLPYTEGTASLSSVSSAESPPREFSRVYGAISSVWIMIPVPDLVRYCSLQFAADTLRYNCTLGLTPEELGDDQTFSDAFDSSGARHPARARSIERITDESEQIMQALDRAGQDALPRLHIKPIPLLFDWLNSEVYLGTLERLQDRYRSAQQVITEVREQWTARPFDVLKTLSPIQQRYLIITLLRELAQRRAVLEAEITRQRPKSLCSDAVWAKLRGVYWEDLQAAARRRMGILPPNRSRFQRVRDELERACRDAIEHTNRLHEAMVALAQQERLRELLQALNQQLQRYSQRATSTIDQLDQDAAALQDAPSAPHTLEILRTRHGRLWHALYSQLLEGLRPAFPALEHQPPEALREHLLSEGIAPFHSHICAMRVEDGLQLEADALQRPLREHTRQKLAPLARQALFAVPARKPAGGRPARRRVCLIPEGTSDLLTEALRAFGEPLAQEGTILNVEPIQSELFGPSTILVHETLVGLPLCDFPIVIEQLEPPYIEARQHNWRRPLHTDGRWERLLPDLNPHRPALFVDPSLQALADGLLAGWIERTSGTWHILLQGEPVLLGTSTALALARLARLVDKPADPFDTIEAFSERRAVLLDQLTAAQCGAQESSPFHGVDKAVLHALVTAVHNAAPSPKS